MRASSATRRLIRHLATRSTIVSERFRARRLALKFSGVTVHPLARLGRNSRVSIADGGRLALGPCAIANNVIIQVAAGGTVVLNGSFVGPNSVIVCRKSIAVEGGVMIAEMCVIRDSDHLREPDQSISMRRYASAPIVIARDAWLGAHVTVLKGVEIGPGATVGAGAVVTRSVPAGFLATGVPAKTRQIKTEPQSTG